MQEINQGKDNCAPTLRNYLQDLVFLGKKTGFQVTLRYRRRREVYRVVMCHLCFFAEWSQDPGEVTKFTPVKMDSQLKHFKVFGKAQTLGPENCPKWETLQS